MKHELLTRRLARRDFLKVSSAAVVSPAIVAVNDGGTDASSAVVVQSLPNRNSWSGQAPHDAAGSVDRPGLPEIDAGSFSGNVTTGYYDGTPNGYFKDVDELAFHDSKRQAVGASIEVVDGELSEDSHLGDVRSLHLSFALPSQQAGEMRVWYRQLAPISHSSSTMSFWLPFEGPSDPHCWLGVRLDDKQGTSGRIPIAFGPGGIRSGYYAIAITPADSIDWDSYQLRGSEGGNSLCLTGEDCLLTDVPWVLLSVLVAYA